jgi:hypothetical protein
MENLKIAVVSMKAFSMTSHITALTLAIRTYNTTYMLP